MDKAKVHHYWIRLRGVTLYIPLVSLIIFSGISVWALRANNLQMLELKAAVITADEQDGDVEAALEELRAFVNSHMNTRLRTPGSTEPPIQLVNRFNKLVALEESKAQTDASTAQLYQKAQEYCRNVGASTTPQASCVKDYFIANGGGGTYVKLPPKELYTFDFASPRWSPDLAGYSLILAFISGVLLIARLIIGRIIKNQT